MSTEATYPLADDSLPPGDVPVDDGLPKDLVHDTDHVAEGVARLIEQYKRKPRLAAVLTIYLEQIQELEDALFGMILDRVLTTATAAQLEAIGRIVGQVNLGLTDDDYRALIVVRIKVNRSDGRADQLLEILGLMALIGSDEEPEILFTDEPPAAFSIQLLTDIGDLDPDLVFSMLLKAKGAGIRMNFLFSFEPLTETFTFDSDTSETLDAALGFGDTLDAGTGGKLSSVMAG